MDLASGPRFGHSWTRADICVCWPRHPLRVLWTCMDDWYWYVAKLFPRFLKILTLFADSLYVYSLIIFMVLVLIINKAEHNVLYQYHLVNATNHYMGLIQTESVSNNIYVYNLIDLIFVIVALFPTQTFTSGAFWYRYQVQ